MSPTSIGAAIVWLLAAGLAHAQSSPKTFVGIVGGVSTLSADARSDVTSAGIDASLYKPENGPALNVLAGGYLHEYVAAQANYVWNRNDVVLTSIRATGSGTVFYEQPRVTSQHALVGDVLVYFRERRSAVRPYLSVGFGLVRLEMEPGGEGRVVNLAAPPVASESIHSLLRVAVGIDVTFVRRWSARYSFSESLSGNPISWQLSPPGQRGLANFQNLFGVVRAF